MSYLPNIDLSNVLNKTVLPIYKSTFRDDNRYIVYKGGAGAGKSRFIAQKILYRIIYQTNHRFLIVRKVKDTMKASVFQLFKDYIHSWGIESKFKIVESPLKITHIETKNTILFMGVDNPEKLKSIEKITSIWIEEASELEENDFNELDRRLRGNLPNYKQIILSFNPISHLHWLKKRFFDNPPKNCTVIETTYLDNPKLSEDDIDVLLEMKNYDIQQYNIYALNEWGVLNTNVVYHNFDFKKHSTQLTIDDFEVLHCGIDFNVGGCVVVLCGIRNDKVYVVDGFAAYDTDEIVTQLLSTKYRDKTFVLYPDASGKNRSSNASRTNISILRECFKIDVAKANPPVRDRINSTNRMFATDRIYINDKLEKLIYSLQTQAYKANGEPEKWTEHKGGAVDDWCFDGETKVIINDKEMSIKNIPESGNIRSYENKNVKFINGGSKGYDNLCCIKLVNGKIIKATPDHKFLTLNGWKEAKNLTGETLCNTELFQTSSRSSTVLSTIREQMDIFIRRLEQNRKKYKKKAENLFIERFGLFIKEQFQKVLLSITKMKISQIIISQTLYLWNRVNIGLFIQKNSTKTIQNIPEKQSKNIKISVESGINLKKVESGTKSIIEKISINSIKQACIFVKYVQKNLKQFQRKILSTAQEDVHQRREEIVGLMMKQESVKYVKPSLLQTNIQKQKLALKVVEVSLIGETEIYCLTVPDDGCFSLADGTIVSNCDGLSYFVNRKFGLIKNRVTKKKLKFA